MKSVMKALLAAALVVGLSPHAHAAFNVQGGEIQGISSEPLRTCTVSSDTNSACSFAAGNLILGFKVSVTSAGGHCALYDGATVAGDLIDELIEPTSAQSALHLWPRPYKLITDLSIDVNTAGCTIYYQ